MRQGRQVRRERKRSPAHRSLFGVPPAMPVKLLLPAATLFASGAALAAAWRMSLHAAAPVLGGWPPLPWLCAAFMLAALSASAAYGAALKRLPVAAQLYLHFLLILAAFLLIPFDATPWRDLPHSPSQAALRLMERGGLPVFTAAANLTLIPCWWGRLARRRASRLPAAAALGAVSGVLLWLTFAEPLLDLSQQAQLWRASFVALAALVAACGIAACGIAAAGAPAQTPAKPYGGDGGDGGDTAGGDGGFHRPPWRWGLRWAALAAAPAAIAAASPTAAADAAAPIPLAGAAALILYLLGASAAFLARRSRHARLWRLRLYLAVALAHILLNAHIHTDPYAAQEALRLALLLTTAGLCLAASLLFHAALFERRPRAPAFAAFYLWASLGAAAGGGGGLALASLLSDIALAMPLLATLTLAVLPGPQQRRIAWPDALLPVALFAITLSAALTIGVGGGTAYAVILLAVALAVLLAADARPRRGAACASLVLVALWSAQDSPLAARPSLQAPYRVVEEDGRRVLRHGLAIEGVERYSESARQGEGEDMKISGLYAPHSPASVLFSNIFWRAKPRAFAAIGLGAGALACHMRPGDSLLFIEGDPALKALAGDDRLFSYLKDCGGGARLALGPARPLLAREADGALDALIVRLSPRDPLPFHLMTVEALELYLAKLKADGLVLFAVSPHVPAVVNLLIRLGQERRLALRIHLPAGGGQDGANAAASWVAMAREEETLRVFSKNLEAKDNGGGNPAALASSGWRPPPRLRSFPPWRDSYVSVAAAWAATLAAAFEAVATPSVSTLPTLPTVSTPSP